MLITVLDGKSITIGRALRGWSQRELAQIAGLKPHRVWKLENNVSSPRPVELAKILRALSTGE